MPLDIYGGRTDISCTNATGHWITTKISGRWWLCTPAGHAMFYQGVGSWDASPPAKYGSACLAAANATKEVSNWGFNGVGEISLTADILPNGTCSGTSGFVNLPRIETIETSLYSTAGPFSLHQNFTGYATAPTKNMRYATDANAHLFLGGAGLVDVFDPVYSTFANALAADQLPGLASNAYMIGVMMDDTDFLAGMSGTSDFDSQTVGHNKSRLSYIVAVTSPIQTWSNSTYNQTPVFYSDVNVYSKNAMASPPGICNATTPCSLSTYLSKKYSATIANLNTAWGSSYTTFGSSGQCVGYTSTTGMCGSGSGSSVETLGTGNGIATVFNHTLANTTVSTNSVQVLLNTDIISGDCPLCGVTVGGTIPPMVSPAVAPINTSVLLGDSYLDTSGYRQTVTTAGLTAGSQPSWNATYHGSTTFGAAVLRNDGPLPLTGPQPFEQDNPCTGSGSGFPAASFWSQITYHGTPPTGISNQIPSRDIVGETCSAGQTVRVSGPDGDSKAQSNPSWATGYDVYAACRVASGGASVGCAAAASGKPALTLQASNVPIRQISSITCTGAGAVTVTTTTAHGMATNDKVDLYGTTGGFDADFNSNQIMTSTGANTLTYTFAGSVCPSASGSGGTIWKEFFIPNAPMGSGSALPSPPSTINYTTGAVQVTLTAPLQSGVVLGASYVANGWGLGTGLLDEDGRNTAWMGTESVCMKPVAGGGAGTASYACRPSNPGGYPAPNAATAVAADLTAWETQFAAKYFGIIKNSITTNASALLYLGCDTLGDWGLPPFAEILAGANPYLDITFWNWFGDQPNSSDGLAIMAYATAQLGDKPMLNFLTLEANPDSAMAGSSSGGVFQNSSQPNRALQWNTIVSRELNTLSANNSYQWVGAVWWGLHDFTNEGFNWGLKTVTDNAYDAHEAASGSVACSAPLAAFTCGSEPVPGGSAVRPFGDLFGGTTGVVNTNALWLGNLPTVGGAISGIFAGKGVISGKSIFS